MQIREIELLAPARDMNIGKQAILHGADAVYIGGPQFGARSAVGNSIEEIEQLCQFAHIYNAKVYVTLNTILYDNEIENAEKLIYHLYEVGVDALITQDLALMRMNLPPIALHASTQMDNRTIEDVNHRKCEGFTRVVLARELPLSQIQSIAKDSPLDIEAFVHGALCVSYSGKCYASQYCFGRSANRGECAQFCRLGFDLVDEKGEILQHDKHLLSLKDMMRIEHLEAMMDAGVMSFKIEGRLKDEKYVKNVTSAYSQAINEIISRRPNEYKRASIGSSIYNFKPNLFRTFNRGYTPYFLNNDKDIISQPDSPKSFGEYIGIVENIQKNKVKISYTKDLSSPLRAGDGLCFISTTTDKLEGIRVSSIENGWVIFNNYQNPLKVGIKVWRNFDIDFDRQLCKPTAKRHIPIQIEMTETNRGFLFTAIAYDDIKVEYELCIEKVLAKTSSLDSIRKQLSKLGNTPFVASTIVTNIHSDYFIPTSILNECRRNLIYKLQTFVIKNHRRESPNKQTLDTDRVGRYTTSEDNVSNKLSESYLQENGTIIADRAFELDSSTSDVLMTCKHCILRHTQRCRKAMPHSYQQLYLCLPDGKRFPIKFNCKKCEMQVLKPMNYNKSYMK